MGKGAGGWGLRATASKNRQDILNGTALMKDSIILFSTFSGEVSGYTWSIDDWPNWCADLVMI